MSRARPGWPSIPRRRRWIAEGGRRWDSRSTWTLRLRSLPAGRGFPWRFAVAAVAAAAATTTGSPALRPAAAPLAPSLAGLTCLGTLPVVQPPPPTRPGRLLFGIYPGGQAGALLASGNPRIPDDLAKELAALAALSGGRPFVVHLYTQYGGDVPPQLALTTVLSQVATFTTHGYFIDLAVTYRTHNDVPGFVAYVRRLVDTVGPNPRMLDLQVTNEVNLAVSPNTSDGFFGGAKDALIQGVVAAKDEARRIGAHQLSVGFNWFYRTDPVEEGLFWGYLRDHGGPAFLAALDWVGIDIYPGTFFPPADLPEGLTPVSDRQTMVNAFSLLRDCIFPAIGIPERVALHITENGWPTGIGRPEAEQASKLQVMTQAAVDHAGTYHLTDYRWFDLRDSDSTGLDFEQHYGLLRDDYSEKPAFAAYRQVVAQASVLDVATTDGAASGSSAASGGTRG